MIEQSATRSPSSAVHPAVLVDDRPGRRPGPSCRSRRGGCVCVTSRSIQASSAASEASSRRRPARSVGRGSRRRRGAAPSATQSRTASRSRRRSSASASMFRSIDGLHRRIGRARAHLALPDAPGSGPAASTIPTGVRPSPPRSTRAGRVRDHQDLQVVAQRRAGRGVAQADLVARQRPGPSGSRDSAARASPRGGGRAGSGRRPAGRAGPATPAARSWSAGPIPESISRCGEPIAPAARTISSPSTVKRLAAAPDAEPDRPVAPRTGSAGPGSAGRIVRLSRWRAGSR